MLDSTKTHTKALLCPFIPIKSKHKFILYIMQKSDEKNIKLNTDTKKNFQEFNCNPNKG